MTPINICKYKFNVRAFSEDIDNIIFRAVSALERKEFEEIIRFALFKKTRRVYDVNWTMDFPGSFRVDLFHKPFTFDERAQAFHFARLVKTQAGVLSCNVKIFNFKPFIDLPIENVKAMCMSFPWFEKEIMDLWESLNECAICKKPVNGLKRVVWRGSHEWVCRHCIERIGATFNWQVK